MRHCQLGRFFHIRAFESGTRSFLLSVAANFSDRNRRLRLEPIPRINRRYFFASGLSSKERAGWLSRAAIHAFVILATLFLVTSYFHCWGQATTGSIAGTVADATGAVVSNAAITATNTSTGVASRTTADFSGHYNFLSLPAGTYNLSAEQTGFDTTTLAGISLRLYQQLTQNIVLTVGTQKQTVTVQAAATLVDTTNASLGTTVNQKSILDMPLDLREIRPTRASGLPGTVDTTGRSPGHRSCKRLRL